MERDYIYLIGSGTTTRKILERMSLPYTLLGIDVVKENRLIAKDANEETILKILRDKNLR